MTEILYEGPVNTPEEIISFAFSVDKVIEMMKPNLHSSDMDARTMLLYTLVHSPIASPGRYEIKLPQLIQRNGQLCSASLVIKTKQCRLVWRGTHACFDRKRPELADVRMTMENIQSVTK